MVELKNITIYTDGACSGNPGIGGWGAVLLYQGHIKELSGAEEYTTNNRMELTAAIEAIKAVKQKSNIDIYTDSAYVKNGITQYMFNWIKNGWKTADKKPVKNIEFWQMLQNLQLQHNVNWHWVKGHNGIELNEKADELARTALKNLQIQLKTKLPLTEESPCTKL